MLKGRLKYFLPYGLLIIIRKLREIYRIISFKRRNRKIIKSYFISTQIRKLQIGCGHNIIEGWYNTDMYPINKRIMFLDARKRFPFHNCTFNYIFCEHVIEHLEYREGILMLNECYRVLKPLGKIRISTPDLRFLIELYTKNKTNLQERYIRWLIDYFLPDPKNYSDTFVINIFFRDWGHKFIYDYKTLKVALEKTGFNNISSYRPRESDDENLKDLELRGYTVSHEFNELDSLVLEGIKPENMKNLTPKFLSAPLAMPKPV